MPVAAVRTADRTDDSAPARPISGPNPSGERVAGRINTSKRPDCPPDRKSVASDACEPLKFFIVHRPDREALHANGPECRWVVRIKDHPRHVPRPRHCESPSASGRMGSARSWFTEREREHGVLCPRVGPTFEGSCEGGEKRSLLGGHGADSFSTAGRFPRQTIDTCPDPTVAGVQEVGVGHADQEGEPVAAMRVREARSPSGRGYPLARLASDCPM